MKKVMALILAMVMVMALAACGGKEAEVTPTEPAADTVEVPGSALEILENVWALYSDDEKFPVMGGDMVNMVDGAPGAYGLEDAESVTYQLLVPAEEVANIDEAASLFHGMMLNNFTCGVFRVSGDAAAFADAMYGKISTNPWMCGMPEKMVIATIGAEYVVAMFGVNDAVNPFEAKLAEAYADADVKYSEAITG